MTQVKCNDQKWWVLLNGNWVEISQKDWEKIIPFCMRSYEWHAFHNGHNWFPTPDQIYSLPNEVEFEIREECKNGCNVIKDIGYLRNCLAGFNKKGCANILKVAHLKDSERKKEGLPEPFDGSCELPTLDEAMHELANKIERSEEVKKEPKELAAEWIKGCGDSEIRRMYGHHVRSFVAGYNAGLKDSQSEIESLRETNKQAWGEYYKMIDRFNELAEEIKELESKLASAYGEGKALTKEVTRLEAKLSPKEE